MVFERHDPEERVPYNLSGKNALVESSYASGVRSLFKLMEGNQNRRDVFELVFNRCFLEAREMNREEGEAWLKWADDLNLYHAESAYEQEMPVFHWQWGAKRLRLGRIMEQEGERDFSGFIPYSDINSGDENLMSEFSLLMNQLESLKKLKTKKSPGIWAEEMEGLLNYFLTVPEEDGKEKMVRTQVFEFLKTLKNASFSFEVDVSWVRGYLENALREVDFRQGMVLRKGVNIGTLENLKGIPFKKLYILGLNGGEFPGVEELPVMNLRWERLKDKKGTRTHIDDITDPKLNRALFLEALFAAENLILTYDARDIEKDEQKYPSSMVLELESEAEILLHGEDFLEAKIPISRYSGLYFHRPGEQENEYNRMKKVTDLIYNQDPREREFILSRLFEDMEKEPEGAELLQERLQKRRKLWEIAVSAQDTNRKTVNVDVSELKLFLEHPLKARLKKHLGLREEELEDRSLEHTEPFRTSALYGHQLLQESLFCLLESRKEMSAEGKGVSAILDRFYSRDQLRAQNPLHGYGKLDQKKFEKELENRVAHLGKIPFPDQPLSDLNLTFEQQLNWLEERGIEALKFSGKLNPAWNESGTMNHCVFVKGKAQTSGSRDEKVYLPTKHLLGPFLFFQTYSLFNPEIQFARIYVSYADALISFDFKSLRDSNYVKDLVLDYSALFSGGEGERFTTLPYSLILNTFSAKQLKDLPPDLNWYEKLNEKLAEELDNSRQYILGDLDNLTDAGIPENAFSLIQKRFGEYFQTRGGVLI
jgi:exonuclease V gamma subunit